MGDERFADVVPDFAPHPASPRFADEQGEGLLVEAPARVRAGSGSPVPLCCAYRLRPATEQRVGAFEWVNAQLVVYREDGSWATVGSLGEMPAPPPSPRPDLSDMPRDAEDDAIPLVEPDFTGGYRNVDVREQVELPPGPDVIHLFVSWGGLQSNTVRIELTAEGK